MVPTLSDHNQTNCPHIIASFYTLPEHSSSQRTKLHYEYRFPILLLFEAHRSPSPITNTWEGMAGVFRKQLCDYAKQPSGNSKAGEYGT